MCTFPIVTPKSCAILTALLMTTACADDGDGGGDGTGTTEGSTSDTTGAGSAGTRGGGETTGSDDSGGSTSGGTASGGMTDGGSATDATAGTAGSDSAGTGTASGGSSSDGTAGSDGSGTTATGGSTGDTTGGVEPTCDGDSTCVAAAPADWMGPVRAEDFTPATTPPECPAPFETVAADLSEGFDPGMATCDCECTPPSFNTCTMPIFYGAASCPDTTGTPDVYITPNECAEADEGAGYYAVGEPIRSFGDCTPSDNHQIDVPTFTTAVRLCSGTLDAPGCEAEERCVPSDADLCIYREGDHACPAGPYTVKRLLHADSTDTRACSTCECGEASGECVGDMTFRGGGCTGTSLEVVTGTGCTSGSIDPSHAVFTWNTWTGACPEQGGVLSGSAEATMPTTACCLP